MEALDCGDGPHPWTSTQESGGSEAGKAMVSEIHAEDAIDRDDVLRRTVSLTELDQKLESSVRVLDDLHGWQYKFRIIALQ